MAGELNAVDGLHPRIRLGVGITISNVGKYSSAHVDAGLEVDKPSNMTTEQTFQMLEDLLEEKAADVLQTVMEMVK